MFAFQEILFATIFVVFVIFAAACIVFLIRTVLPRHVRSVLFRFAVGAGAVAAWCTCAVVLTEYGVSLARSLRHTGVAADFRGGTNLFLAIGITSFIASGAAFVFGIVECFSHPRT